MVKNPPANTVGIRGLGSILGLGRSPGGGYGNSLQYSCLENPMDRGAWQAMVHWVTKNQTWLKQLSMHNHYRWILWFVNSVQFSSVQSLSHVWLFVTPWTAARQASLSITNSRSSPKPMSIESVMPPNPLILCHPLLLLPSIFPSIRVFSEESTLHQVAKVLEFQLQCQSLSDRMWSTGEGNSKPLQYCCLENPMNSMKR